MGIGFGRTLSVNTLYYRLAIRDPLCQIKTIEGIFEIVDFPIPEVFIRLTAIKIWPIFMFGFNPYPGPHPMKKINPCHES